MKVLSLREGATAAIVDGLFTFNGAAGSEFLNTRRTTPMLPPSHVLEVKPDTVYKIYSGLAVEVRQMAKPDVRPTLAYWRSYGVRVERVDYEPVTDTVSELVVYITTINGFNLKPREPMFESFNLAHVLMASVEIAEVEIFEGVIPNRAEGFVPAAKKSIQDAGARRQGDDANTAKAVDTDEANRKKLDAWLNTPDEKPGQVVTPGAPAGAIPASSGITAAPSGVEAQVVEKGGVRAAKPTG